MLMWITLVLMVLVGVVDLWLITAKRDTISKRYHRLFPQFVDSILMIVVLVLVWQFFGVKVFTGVMAGTILGHLAWHETND